MQIYFWMMVAGGTLLVIAFILSEIFEWLDDILEGVFDWLNFDTENAAYFSLRSLMAFFAFFGAAGWMSMKHYHLGPEWSILPAVVLGSIGLFGVGWVTNKIRAQAGSSELLQDDYIGISATVTIAIPEDGDGMVTMSPAGQTVRLSARSQDGKPIPYGCEVQVVRKESNLVVVKKVS